ncbi:MAG: [FeFe] hydrogenase H-cluster radical SAM maturase HydE [Culturomica sp.]|nr:[FeFe] hydrogenase H-cluster radical SAM maturase HydE [Culturomica sp.]
MFSLIRQANMNRAELHRLLRCTGEEEELLYKKAAEVRNSVTGNAVYLRGLIEVSNACGKNCLYCGIRSGNGKVQRYLLDDRQILESALFAYKNRYGSIVLQGGENQSPLFTGKIDRLIREIKQQTDGRLGITLSLGEQHEETYRQWFESGAHRYLLRIETSNPELYARIHPDDAEHSFRKRLACLESLQRCGYQTGSGVMIGLPFQTTEDLANDLLFLKERDVDMVGMGPYLEHPDTPLYAYREQLLPQRERLRLALHAIACLRLLVPDLNIAATTALQAIDPQGREQALKAGANVIMPNITPAAGRSHYKLYQNKPDYEEGAAEMLQKLETGVREAGCRIAFDQWGDPQHGKDRKTVRP